MSGTDVTYVTLNLEELKGVVAEVVAMHHDDDILLDMAGVKEHFRLSKPMIYALVREGAIKPKTIQGRPRVVRYSRNEIKSLFTTAK